MRKLNASKMKTKIFIILISLSSLVHSDEDLTPPPFVDDAKMTEIEAKKQFNEFEKIDLKKIDTIEISGLGNQQKPIYIDVKDKLKLILPELTHNMIPGDVVEYEMFFEIKFGSMANEVFVPAQNCVRIFLLQSDWTTEKNHQKPGAVIRCKIDNGPEVDYCFRDNQKIVHTKKLIKEAIVKYLKSTNSASGDYMHDVE